MQEGESLEQTFVMIKPDGVQRSLIGEIISRFEKRGLKVVAMKLIQVSEDLARVHYEEHEGKAFYDKVVNYITSSPVVVMVLEGMNAVEVVRKMTGSTNPQDASIGTLRGDYCLDIGRNVIHASDSLKNAEREISLFFRKEEFVHYKRIDEDWVYE